MANEINTAVSASVMNSLRSPVGAGNRRTGVLPDRQPGAARPDSSESRHKAQDGSFDNTIRNKEVLGYILELSERLSLASTTTMHFERSDENGKMYLYVKDKITGEELYRIPRDLVGDLDPPSSDARKLDIRI